MRPLRWLFLTSDYEGADERFDAAVAKLAATAPSAVLVSSSADWLERFPVVGTWTSWADEVAVGTKLGGVVVYDGFIADGDIIGPINGRVVEKALGASKPVRLFTEEEALVPVKGVRFLDRQAHLDT